MDVDIAQLKDQLRSCAARLQRAQSKFESSTQATKRDISTLLRQEAQHRSQASFHRDALNARTKADEADRTLGTARQKAEKIMSEDRKGRIMNILERGCDVLAEARVLPNDYQDLGQDLLVSVCNIIEGATRVDAKELHTLRHLLSDIYDPLTSAAKRQSHVHPTVIQPLTRPPQHVVDSFLVSVARASEVEWQPPYPLPEQRLRSIAQLLDPNSSPSVNLAVLKSFCAMGIPDQPPWIRPQVWGLLLGLVPSEKGKWSAARQRLRSDYVALVGPILTSVRNLSTPPSTTKPEQMDKYLIQFSNDIDALPSSIRQELDEIDFPEPPPQTANENEPTSPPLQYADAVSVRLDAIRAQPGFGAAKSPLLVPTITLESASPRPDADLQDAQAATMLFTSSGKPKSSVWEGALLRLLHTHCVLHASYNLPEGPSSALAAILGVLLCVFSYDITDMSRSNSKTRPAKTDHTRSLDAEAAAFWAMEALISGLREALEEETDPTLLEGWNHEFSRMLRAVDAPLWEDLRQKSLDPALPYYSSRWIPTLFTHALPVREALPIWDAVFTLPAFAHDAGRAPQVEFLLDVGVTMLARARVPLLRLGKSASPAAGPRSLWAEEPFALPSSNLQTPGAHTPVGSPSLMSAPLPTPWGLVGGPAEGEAGEAFLKGLKILQTYNVEEFGGVERVLQSAWELYANGVGRGSMEMPGVRTNGMRETQANGRAKHDHQQPQMSRFDQLAEVVWRGLTNEATSPSPSPPPTAPPSPGVPQFKITAPPPSSSKSTDLGFGARIRDVVWKGVTNQVPPDIQSSEPSPEPSPAASRSVSPLLVADDEAPKLEQDQKPQSGSGGGWFGGIRDSDAAAALAKTSTNLRVRAMDVLGRTSPKPEPRPQHEPVPETLATPLSSGSSWAASLTAFRLGFGAVSENGDPHFDAGSRHGTQTPEREVFASTSKHVSYTPPPRPSFFRPARDSALPTAAPSFSTPSPVSESPTGKGSAIQSALAALTGSSILAPAPVKKSVPKPLLLNSKSLMTAYGSPRTPSRSASPLAPNSADGCPYTSASSSRTNSVDQFAPGASGVVSLRRGPITSARMVGGPHTGRAAFNSRDSISSAGSNRYSDRRFSYEGSSAGERDSKVYSFGRSKNAGFIVDRGLDSPITVGNRDSTSTGTSGARTSPPQSSHPEEGVHERVVSLNDFGGTGATEKESGHEGTIPSSVLLRVASDESSSEAERMAASPQAKLRARRHRDTSISELNLEARKDPGNDTLASPPSAGFSSSLEPGVAYDDTTPLSTTPTTPNSTITIERRGATLNRSRTPRAVRRPRKGMGEENICNPAPRTSGRTGSAVPSRDSTALVSGSEEEGAKADVEDELYTDLINSY